MNEFTINGLTVERLDHAEPARSNCDIAWRVRRDSDLPKVAHDGVAFLRVEGEMSPSGVITHHLFGTHGRMRCRFSVSPEGGNVTASVAPEVDDGDIVGLFSEPVMRTVLVRQGRTSFHAAALFRNGNAILIMGGKGAGKSTLSAALQQQGWSLMADDLVRVDTFEGVWHAFAGHRQTKLTPASARAFGYDGALRTRWKSAPAGDETDDGKVILPADPARPTPAVAPIAALFILESRRGDLDEIDCTLATPANVVRALVENATPDPLAQAEAPAMVDPRPISGLAGQAAIYRVALPDRLSDLAASARAIAALVRS